MLSSKENVREISNFKEEKCVYVRPAKTSISKVNKHFLLHF